MPGSTGCCEVLGIFGVVWLKDEPRGRFAAKHRPYKLSQESLGRVNALILTDMHICMEGKLGFLLSISGKDIQKVPTYLVLRAQGLEPTQK
jgi:hypothetical protein